MLIDLSLEISANDIGKITDAEKLASFGHMGTHFDVMDKEFPLAFTRRKAMVYNIKEAVKREILPKDLAGGPPGKGCLAAFYTGIKDKWEYGSDRYFKDHPVLSYELIDLLLDSGVSLIGLDFAGLRRGDEHTPTDEYCADRGVFIIENLCNLDKILQGKSHAFFTAHIYPLKIKGLTGLPCRVVGEL